MRLPILVLGFVLLSPPPLAPVAASVAGQPQKSTAVPTIRCQPTPQTGILGGRAIFTVIANGDPRLSYQWRKNGRALSDGAWTEGATSEALILIDLVFADAGDYSVVVSTASWTATSIAAALTVNVPRGGDVDPSFAPGASIDGAVMSVAAQPDGKVLIGGAFTTMSGAVRSGIARLAADGRTDHTFGNGLTGVNGTVWSIAVQPDGRVLIGGYFTEVNGESRSQLARLNADASLDPTFVAETNDGVHALAVQPDGRVLIGGSFTQVNGQSRGHLARLNANGSLDETFLDGPAGANDSVYALAVQPDGRVLIGGSFTKVGGASRGYVARLEVDGSLDETFGLVGPNSIVAALAVQPDGGVLIAGCFTTVDGEVRNRIARLNTDGSLDASFQHDMAGADDFVLSVALQPDGRVLIAGLFTAVGGAERARIARLNADGSLDTTFLDDLAGANAVVESVALQPDGRVLIGGHFTTVNESHRHRVARLGADGTLDRGFHNGAAGADGVVADVSVQPDGRVLIGGWFDAVDGMSRNHVARLNRDGSLDPSFRNDLAGPNGAVLALAVQPDARVLIAGCFTAVDGVSRNGIARLDADGSLDPSFLDALPGADNDVVALVVQPDGRVLIAGWFTAVNGVSRNAIARLHADGSLDRSFLNRLAGASAVVESLALQPDGRVLIGGPFTTVNDVSRNGIARLNADGSLDGTFLDGLAGANNVVRSLVVQPDGRVLIGGDFTVVNGYGRNYVARLDTDGSLDTTFVNGLVNNSVLSMALQPDGRVVIGGTFTAIEGESRSYIARLNAAGDLDTTFMGDMAGANDPVRSIDLQPDGRMLTAGWFTAINGQSGPHIARLYGDVPAAP